MLKDFKFALRQLSRSPGFALTAIVTLALGIGASTTMTSVLRGTLLAPLPYAQPQQLAGIGLGPAGQDPNADQTGETYDFLLAHITSFRSLGLADDGARGENLSSGAGSPRAVRATHVNAAYFSTLGLAPILGRTFTAEEDRPGTGSVLLIGESLWRTQFNGDPGMIGRTVHLNADPYTVIGVMPSITNGNPEAAELWEPLRLSPQDPGYDGTNYQLTARLKPGVTLAQAAAELAALNPELLRSLPGLAHSGPPGSPAIVETIYPLQQVLVSQARTSILTLSAAVFAVLLIACLNLAGLIVARTAGRRQELALRAALGAGRASLLRLLLTETALIAFAGSIAGLLLGLLALPILVAASPLPLPQLASITLDSTTIAIALTLGLVTAVLFGLLPAVGALRLNSTRTVTSSIAQRRLGQGLIVAQVALATLLLSAGALFLGSFLKMRALSPGVRAEGLTLVQVNLKGTAYNSSAHTAQFITATEARLRALPGAPQVATAVGLPLDRGLNNSGGPLAEKAHLRYVETRFISPGYFQTVGTAILNGQDLSPSDTVTSARVAILNQRAADKWFPGKSALGEYVIEGGGQPLRVIAVVADAHDRSLAGTIAPTIYIPFSQTDDATTKMFNGWFPVTFVLRSSAPIHPQFTAAAIAAVDPEISVARQLPMQSLVETSTAAPRFFSWLAGGFALFALLLTLIGLFGLLTYQVGTRVREFGVRMALGADRRNILQLILANGLTLTAAGLMAGILASFFLQRLIASLLADSIDLNPRDVKTILASPALAIALSSCAMLLCALVASLIPAHRASSIQPTEALRSE